MYKKIMHRMILLCVLPLTMVSANTVTKEQNLTDEQLHAVMNIITNFILSDDSVSDRFSPVITLNGDKVITLNLNETYNEPGSNVIDNYDKNLTVSISGSVDVTKVGTYTLTYSVTDSAGNKTEVTRVVNIVLPPDITVPTITLKGANPQTVEAGATYQELGAVANDEVDGNLTGSIKIVKNIDTSKLGNHEVKYSVTDKAGNRAEVTRVVKVVDTTAPTITLNRDKNVTLNLNETYNELGANVTDNYDKNLTVSISGSVDTSKVGTYTLTYSATDSSGNKAEVTRVVNIVKALKITDKPIYLLSWIGEELPDSLKQVEAIDYNNKQLSYSIKNNNFDIDSTGTIKLAKFVPYGYYTTDLTVSNGDVSVTKKIKILSAENIGRYYGKATISRDYYDDENGAKTKSEYKELIDKNKRNTIYPKSDGNSSWAQIELPEEANISVISVFAEQYYSHNKDVSVYITKDKVTDYKSLSSSQKVGTLKGIKKNILVLDKIKKGKYIILKHDSAGYFSVSEFGVFGAMLKEAPVVKNSENNITIDKGKDKGDVIAKINAIDYQYDTITYIIKDDVPFSIDKQGNIKINGPLEIKKYEFDVVLSDGKHSTTYHIVVDSKTDTKGVNDAKGEFEEKASAFTKDSNLDELMNSYLIYSHKRAKVVYDDFMETPLDDSFWNKIENDDYLKEGLYSAHFPANPYVIKNLNDFFGKWKSDGKSDTFIEKYKNVALGLSVNARESGIFDEVIFGDTFDHPVIAYDKLGEYKATQQRYLEGLNISELGSGDEYRGFMNYLRIKYKLSGSEADGNLLWNMRTPLKNMLNDGVDIANADYDTRKKYGLSFDGLNLYRLMSGLNRADCNADGNPCDRIKNYIEEKGITVSQFLVDANSSVVNEIGLIEADIDNMKYLLMPRLGILPQDQSQYRLMPFYDLANFKIANDQIPAKDFNDDQPNWPIFKADLNNLPWQILALGQSAQKKECNYIKERFFETDKAKLRESYPPNSVNPDLAERRYITYTTYTWAYDKPEVKFKKSDWEPGRSYFRILQDGGVCGRLSTLGQHANECLNRPSIGIGQPSHRAWAGVFNLSSNPEQYYVGVNQRSGSDETVYAHSHNIYNIYSRGIRSGGLERFTGVVAGTSPASVGERVYNRSMMLQHIAKYLEDEGKSPEAVLKKAVEIAPSNVDAWYQLALYYAKQDMPQKDIDLAKEFMDKRDNIFIDFDQKDYYIEGSSLEVIVGKNIAFTALKAPSIKDGTGDKAEEFKTKLWEYLDKYEKDYRGYISYSYQNKYLSKLYLSKKEDKDGFKREIKELFNRFLNNSTSGFYANKYFEGVDFANVNKTELFDELAEMADSAKISDSRRKKIYSSILNKSAKDSLAIISLNDICADSNLSRCQSIKSFELDANKVYITVDPDIGDSSEVTPTDRGKEGYSTLNIRVVDKLGNGQILKVNMAKEDNGKLLKINDPAEVSTNKTKIIAWIDPKINNLDSNKIYSALNRIILKVKKRVTNNEESMGQAILEINDLRKADSTLKFNKATIETKNYKDDSTYIYFVATDKNIGPDRGVWAKTGDSILNIKVKDDSGNIHTIKLKATVNNYWQMNSGANANMDSKLYLKYDPDINQELQDNTHYKSLYPVTIDARAWHKNNIIVDRLRLEVDFTTP